MAAGGSAISLTTNYQTAFSASADNVAPCYVYLVRAVGNDVTVEVTYAGATAIREYVVASGSELPISIPANRNLYRGITLVRLKAASAAGTAYCNVVVPGEGA